MPFYCPVCKRASDKFPSAPQRDEHLVDMHPQSEEARLITERRRKGYAQELTGGKTST